MKHTITYLVSIAITVILGISSPVHASTITSLFNTGVDETGAVLPNDTIGDPHYSIISAPAGSTTETRIITSEGGFPIGPYIGDNTSSRWIVPNNVGYLNVPIGTYTYRTTFDLTGFDINTASITGQWSTDNDGLDILINGTSLGYTNSSEFLTFSPFSISSGFVEGNNTLDFIVNNAEGTGENPTALRVELTGEASPVPVPAAVWLFGSGLLGLLGIRKKVTS
jgi:hypothetical protein